MAHEPDRSYGSYSHGHNHDGKSDCDAEEDAFEAIEFVAGGHPKCTQTTLRGCDSGGGDQNHAAKGF